MASNEIIVLFISGGRTTHCRFHILINVNENFTCNIKQGSPLAELISRTKLIIWDEALMTHRHCFEVVDRIFRYILRFSNRKKSHLPFGRNFRQILP